MAATKSRRGKTGAKKSKGRSAAAKSANDNGGERLSPAEKRLEGVSLSDRKKAVKMTKNGEAHQDVADFLGLSSVKAKFLVMQQMVEDKDVPAIKSDDKSVLRALKADDGYNSVDWVSCRARIAGGKVKQIAEEAGHSFTRGAPKQKSSSKKGGSKSKRGATAKKASVAKGSKARRGSKSRRGRRPNA